MRLVKTVLTHYKSIMNNSAQPVESMHTVNFREGALRWDRGFSAKLMT